jgi:hypothetical protein
MTRIKVIGMAFAVALALGGLSASAFGASGIAFVGKSATSYAVRAGGCKVPRPANVATGDQMVMQMYVEDPEGAGPFTITSQGWTLVEKVENKSSGIWFQLAVFTKRYEANDPTEYTATWTGTTKRGCGALAVAWSGVSSTEPVNAHLGAPSAGASNIVRGPTITTTKPNSMIAMFGDYNAYDTRTVPPGMEDIGGPEGFIAQTLQPQTGPTGEKDAKTGHAEGNIGILIALTPEG